MADSIFGDLAFPCEWTAFAPLRDDFYQKKPADWEGLPRETLQRVPDEIVWGGQTYRAQRVTARRGQFDLRAVFGEQVADDRRMQAAFVFVPLHAQAGGPVTLGLGGDEWLHAWLNGEPDGAGAYTISIAVVPAS